MLLRPRLAVRRLGLAHNDNRNICLLRRFRSSANAGLLVFCVCELRIIFVPPGPSLFSRRDLAALCVQYFRSRSCAYTNAFQYTHSSPWISRVTTQMNVGCV